MTWQLLSADLVIAIHDAVLNPGELQGLAMNKSLEGALGRVEFRVGYDMIADVFDLAAAYCEAVAQGHCFNDGNKRTAHQTMDVCLAIHGIEITWSHEEVGKKVIALAQGHLEPEDLAAWLRLQAG